MSRGAFRARVDAPRPHSAWVLVTVASATLWITQQLDAWAMAVQAGALLFSLWRRERPFAWQKSALALNLPMAGITTATIAVALRGEPSTIALAHFAALMQGLQLVDARPRHTEFLLVTLALFQVILAANLTDSVFFPPLLVAFVGSAVWTLMVHTLRTEAIEAGDAQGVTRAITPGLLRTTLVASGLSVVLALLLFVTLPRMRTSVVSGSRAAAAASATSGFSDQVRLGDLGRIRRDRTVVLRVETLEGESPGPQEAYFRGLAFDAFDGTSWAITPRRRARVPGSAESGIEFVRPDAESNLVQQIVREPVEAGVLFRVGHLHALQGTVRRLERDASEGLYAAGQADERLRYTVRTQVRPWKDAALRRDRTHLPGRHGERYLQLPPLPEAVGELARRVAAGQGSDAERVRAVESWLRRSGRYTDDPPALGSEDGPSPVAAFLLGELAGHCEYFASGMVVMLRSVGLPARLVNGFAGGRPNPIGGFLEVARADAHTWVEVPYERAGWVRYDPTPPDLRAVATGALSLGERARQLASAVELWWFQSVVGFDRADQMQALKHAYRAWRGEPEPAAPAQKTRRWAALEPGRALRAAAPWLAALLLAVLYALLRGRRRARRGLPGPYATALRLLERRGLVRGPCHTARQFGARVAREHPAAAEPFARLTESYLAERFGDRPMPAHPVELSTLRAALRDRRRRCSP